MGQKAVPHQASEPRRKIAPWTPSVAASDLLFEAPAPAGLPGEDAPRTVIEVEGLEVVILGIEDLLLDRLRALVHWHSEEDGRWADRLAQLYAGDIDWRYLRAKVSTDSEEGAALAALEEKVGSP